MKLLPGLFSEAFDDMVHDSLFLSKNSDHMRTDIREQDGNYVLDMELPGFKKEDIQMELKNGYLNIQASRKNSNEEKDDSGNLIRQERFFGSCSRSFYVGEGIRQEDIKATFENGELKITFPKEDPKAVEQRKFISID